MFIICYFLSLVFIREIWESVTSIPSSGYENYSLPPIANGKVQQSTNSKKPLLKFVKKITWNKKNNSGGCEEWMCTLCNHVFKGSYNRVWHHLLSISGDGIKGCTCTIDKMMELAKLHMASLGYNVMNLENDCNFKVPRSPSHDIKDSVNQNASK